MKINIINENLNTELSLILDEVTELIKANQDEVSVVKNTTCIDNTKGEIITNILITLGTSIASELIVFFVTEAIKRHLDQQKKKIQIRKTKKKNDNYLEIKLEDNESELIINIEE